MLMALQVRRVWKMFAWEGRGAPMTLLAVFTMCCSILRQEAVQPPYQTVMQCKNTLSGAPIEAIHDGRWQCSPQFAQEVEVSLNLLGQRYSVVSVGEVLSYVRFQELGAVNLSTAAPSMVNGKYYQCPFLKSTTISLIFLQVKEEIIAFAPLNYESPFCSWLPHCY